MKVLFASFLYSVRGRCYNRRQLQSGSRYVKILVCLVV